MASETKESSKRFAFIDGLRGLAALAIVGFHFYAGGPLKTPLTQIFPPLISFLLKNGNLAVEVFFVISGFVIAHSLRSTVITSKLSIKLIVFRLIRLHPPYVITIVLTLLLNYFSNLFLSDRQAPISDAHEVFYHLFYIQDILDVKQISPVFWTLCIEIQFYIVFLALLGFCQISTNKFRKQNRYAIFWVFAIFSIFLEANNSVFFFKGYFILYWYAFFLGILIQWVLDGKFHKNYLFIFFAILAFVSALDKNLEISTALITGLFINSAVNYPKIGGLLNHKIFQYFGKISYSLYLVHVLVGSRMINVCFRFINVTPVLALGIFILAISVSIFSAHLMHIYIEGPATKISKKMKNFALKTRI